MTNAFITLILATLLVSCASNTCAPPNNHPLANFCIDTACRSLENSGAHYQRKQQGAVFDCLMNEL